MLDTMNQEHPSHMARALDQARANLVEVVEGVDWHTGQDLSAADRLAAAIGLADAAADVLLYAVESARANGMTWQGVADMFDISRQAAQQRFGAGASGR